MASCRWWLSSKMLCSMELFARPKVRNAAMAKRRCLRQTWPLLKNRPTETEGCCEKQTGWDVPHVYVIHLSFLGKSSSPLGCKVGPRSCRLVSLWLLSPFSSRTQTLFCAVPDECRTHSHKHQPAVNTGQRIGALLSSMWLRSDAYLRKSLTLRQIFNIVVYKLWIFLLGCDEFLRLSIVSWSEY